MALTGSPTKSCNKPNKQTLNNILNYICLLSTDYNFVIYCLSNIIT